MSRLLLAEDEGDLRATLELCFRREGFEVLSFAEGLSAWKAIASGERFDAAILDISMPLLEGTAILSRLRASGIGLPVIFLTSRDEEIDRVAGLELGADDYVTKPFSTRELVARIRAVLRRYAASGAAEAGPGGGILRSGPLELDPGRYLASYAGSELRLTLTEYRMLECLVRAPGSVRSRERLVEEAWPEDAYAADRAVDSHVKRLRRKLAGAGAPADLLETVYGLGYRLVAAGGSRGGAAGDAAP